MFFFFKQKTAYEMRISDWSSDVCSSDLEAARPPTRKAEVAEARPSTMSITAGLRGSPCTTPRNGQWRAIQSPFPAVKPERPSSAGPPTTGAKERKASSSRAANQPESPARGGTSKPQRGGASDKQDEDSVL